MEFNGIDRHASPATHRSANIKGDEILLRTCDMRLKENGYARGCEAKTSHSWQRAQQTDAVSVRESTTANVARLERMLSVTGPEDRPRNDAGLHACVQPCGWRANASIRGTVIYFLKAQ